jgi:hypothetical protein
MSIWALLGVVLSAGAIGGAINALMTDNGFRLPRWEKSAGPAFGGQAGSRT